MAYEKNSSSSSENFFDDIQASQSINNQNFFYDNEILKKNNVDLEYLKNILKNKKSSQIDELIKQVVSMYSSITNLENKNIEIQEKMKKAEEDIKKQTNRNIEVIGLFSSVLALLIVNANIVLKATDFLTLILLMVGLTCSIAIFASMIHSFFGKNEGRFDKSFWIPIGILIVLLLFGIGFKGYEFYKSNITKKGIVSELPTDKNSSVKLEKEVNISTMTITN